jgi:hypothetical protein
MPKIERIVVRRPLRFRKNIHRNLVADGVDWQFRRDGFIYFRDFGAKNQRPKMPIEALAYILPMFDVPNIELKATETIVFSTHPNLLPHMTADGQHVFYRVEDRWLYLTRPGFVALLRSLQELSPKAYRDLTRLRPTIHE